MSCQQMQRWFSERGDTSELPPELRAHAAVCPDCRAFLWERFGENWLRSVLTPTPQPPDFEKRVTERVMAEIRKRQEAEPSPQMGLNLLFWQAALRAAPAIALALTLLFVWTYRAMDWTELARLSPSERFVLTLDSSVAPHELFEEVMETGLPGVER